METLPKDIQEKILNELSAVEFIKMYNENLVKGRVIEDDEVWFRRFHKDYPFLVPHLRRALEKEKESYKALYLNIFNRIHKVNENVYNNIIESWFGEYFLPFLTKEYKEQLFTFFTEYLTNSIIYILNNVDEISSDWISDYATEYYFENHKINKNNVYVLEKILPKIMSDGSNHDILYEVVKEHTENFLVDLFTYLEMINY